MKTATYQVDEKYILDRVFTCLVEHGLGNITIRELCRRTGIAQGSLYYWFPDKEAIICEATEHGLKKITDEIFEYVFSTIDDLERFFSECLERIASYQNELRFIYQMAASPVYGEKMRSEGKYFKSMYDKYAERLAEYLECDAEMLKPIVYLFISTICDFAIWNDNDTAQREIDYIRSVLPRIIRA